ncbi:DUF488 domain-containing protein [Arthrobacter luteolus]|uniref:DUF488 domain-containing protein n=1 Tax=Arthrobacter luteolus TaxID=98672 RepID=UPI000836955E|nr:DUF488 family protein [Arthrobacter luteolus]
MAAESPTVRIRRIYAEPDGGFRVLVDRLWPRGVSKERAQLDDWLKDVAPSTGLRQWFGHRPERWQGFTGRYLQELSDNPAAASFAEQCRSRPDTVLLFAARNEQQNEAVVIRDYVLGRLGE